MEQLNKIEIKGTVGFVRLQTALGKQVIHLSVATNYVYKGRNGDPVLETTWHNVTAWEGKGMPDFSKIQKGAKIHAIGRLRGQRYCDQDGIERYSYEVVASQLYTLDDAAPLQYEYFG